MSFLNGRVLGLIVTGLGLAVTLIQNFADEKNRQELKDEIKEELKEELSSEE